MQVITHSIGGCVYLSDVFMYPRLKILLKKKKESFCTKLNLISIFKIARIHF